MDSKLRSLMGKNNSLINLEASINIDKIIENREIMDNTEEQIINWDSEVSALQIRKVFRDKICKNEKLKVGGKYISFDDDVWDFSEKRLEGKRHNKYKFDFSSKNKNIHNDFQKDVLKLYVLNLIFIKGVNKVPGYKISAVNKLLNYMYIKGIDDLSKMTISDYAECTKAPSPNTLEKNKINLKQFLEFYSLVVENIYVRDIVEWFETTNRIAVKQQQENNKTKLLPEEFYKKFTELIYKDCFNNQIDAYTRMKYGLIFIQSQVGLRISEILILRVSDLKEKNYGNKNTAKLRYRITKTAKGKKKNYIPAETIANKKVCAIFKELVKLGSERRSELETNLLVPSSQAKKDDSLKAIADCTITNTMNKYCIEHAKELNIINSSESDKFEATNNVYNIKTKKRLPKSIWDENLNDEDIIALPTFTQFRVYVDTALYYSGVDSKTRAYIKGHISADMDAYYSRPKDELKNDIDFKREMIEEISINNGKILGSNKSEELQKKLKTILKNNTFNIEDDIEELIEYIDDEMAITKKKGGFCMKANPNRKCHYGYDDADKYLCASDICPYHCFMYYDLPKTLDTFRDLQKIYQHNLDAEYKNAAQKEGYRIKNLIIQILEPQIKEAERMIEKDGIDQILKSHPCMKDILYSSEKDEEKNNGLEKIKGEIKEWKLKLKIK